MAFKSTDPGALLTSAGEGHELARHYGVTKTVYSLVYPETRQTLNALWAARPHVLFDNAYLDVQDGAEKAFLDKWRDWSLEVVSSLPQLPWGYATAGSNEAIRESVWMYAAKGAANERRAVMHVFEGEYEGYAAYAAATNVELRTHVRDGWRETLLPALRPGDRWYISQPSAIDGRLWPEFDACLREVNVHVPQCDVMVDLTYVGCVPRAYHVDLSHPNVHTVFFSLSKAFGVYYHRIGGCFSRIEMPGLYGNKWFKNMFSLYLGCELMSRFAVCELPRRYQALQSQACQRVAGAVGLGALAASDTVMLGYIQLGDPSMVPEPLKPLIRGSCLRLCLTPTMDGLVYERRHQADHAG